MTIPEAEQQPARHNAGLVVEAEKGEIADASPCVICGMRNSVRVGPIGVLIDPYVQELGIPHAWASIIWICGSLWGPLVQPLVGHLSHWCTSRFGGRRPSILAGAASTVVAVVVIGHSADIGWLFGDRRRKKMSAVVAFVMRDSGFFT